MKKHYKIIFILGADVEKDGDKSFKMAENDKYGLPLLSEWRLKVVQKIYEEKMADKFVIVGGVERRYLNENISRPEIMKGLLVKKYKISKNILEVLKSKPSTKYNVIAIKAYLKEKKINRKKCAFLTNFYHIPRAILFFQEQSLNLHPIAAECFFVGDEREIKLNYGITEFNFSDRLIAELRGMKAEEFGEYK